MCPSLNPWDVNITNERGFPLAGLTVTNDYQAFHIQAGPLYLGDVTTTNVHIPNTQSQEVYNSVFSIDIEGIVLPASSICTVTHNYCMYIHYI